MSSPLTRKGYYEILPRWNLTDKQIQTPTNLSHTRPKHLHTHTHDQLHFNTHKQTHTHCTSTLTRAHPHSRLHAEMARGLPCMGARIKIKISVTLVVSIMSVEWCYRSCACALFRTSDCHRDLGDLEAAHLEPRPSLYCA